MWAMLMHALCLVGKRIICGEPHAEVETASMKLLARSDVELDVAVGSVVLASFLDQLVRYGPGVPASSQHRCLLSAHSTVAVNAGRALLVAS